MPTAHCASAEKQDIASFRDTKTLRGAGGFCSPEFCPFPEGRGYRERWSPFKGKGDGGLSKKIGPFLKGQIGGLRGGAPPL